MSVVITFLTQVRLHLMSRDGTSKDSRAMHAMLKVDIQMSCKISNSLLKILFPSYLHSCTQLSKVMTSQ